MPNFRVYNTKLASLHSMGRVTRTMKMVAATKLRRAQEALRQAEGFRKALEEALPTLGGVQAKDSVYLKPREKVDSALLVVLTSDRGLCGAFNNNIIHEAQRWLAERKDRLRILRAGFYGKRGFLAMRKQVEVRNCYESLTGMPDLPGALRIANDLMNSFAGHKYDEIHLAFAAFAGPLKQEARVERLLPFELPKLSGTPAQRIQLFEPDMAGVLEMLVQKMVRFRVYHAMLQNAAGEQAARMNAMESATSNTETLSAYYTLLRNRLRQAAITTELTEITAGVESMK